MEPTIGRHVDAYYQNGWTPTYVPNEYYSQHPDWDWGRHVTYWNTDRVHWHRDHGRWRRD